MFVIVGARGQLLGWARTAEQLRPPPANGSVLSLPQWDAPPSPPYVWDGDARDFVVPPARAVWLTPAEFWDRLTPEEALQLAGAELEGPIGVRARLTVGRRWFDRRARFNVADAVAQSETVYLVLQLIRLGVIEASEGEARRDALLAPATR